MPGRHDYAMFCYGVLFTDSDRANSFVQTHNNIPLEVQSVGKIVYDDPNEYYIVYVKDAKSSIGSRTGSLIMVFNLSYQDSALQLEFEGNIYTFTWILVMCS